MNLTFSQREAQEREEAEQVRQERIRKEQEEEREVRTGFIFSVTVLRAKLQIVLLCSKVDRAVPVKHGLIVDSPKNDLRNFKGSSNNVEFSTEVIVPGPFLFPSAEWVLFCAPGAVEE